MSTQGTDVVSFGRAKTLLNPLVAMGIFKFLEVVKGAICFENIYCNIIFACSLSYAAGLFKNDLFDLLDTFTPIICLPYEIYASDLICEGNICLLES